MTPINKLMCWQMGNWVKYEAKGSNIFLRIHYDQLLIMTDKKVLEALNMNSKIKGIYKEDVLILIICNPSQEVRKVKFQIKCNIAQCLQKLGAHFPVVSHGSLNAANNFFRYRNMDEIFRKVFEAKDDAILRKIPSDFKKFVKVCLLDPTFPQIVMETQKVLELDL